MSTNATIAVKFEDGSYQQIYCHSDGYIEWTGKRLVEHFNDQELAERLVSMGNMSILGKEIGVKHDWANRFNNPDVKDFCCFYGRDRGDTGEEPYEFDSFEQLARDGMQENYNYLFIDGVWYYTTNSIIKERLMRLELAEEVNV